MSTLHPLLCAVEPLLKRCRPLARVRGQFMADLAALLSGLRNTVMLDYAPGVTPQQLRDVVGVLDQLMHTEHQAPSMRQFIGVVLHLDGCCYLANAAGLIQQLLTAAADVMFVSFVQGRASLQGPQDTQVKKLHQQLQPLITTLQQQLDKQLGVNVPESITDTGKSTITTHTHSGRMFSLAGWDVLDLSGFAGLPVMPTLNGILLGYPIVYWVQQIEEAVAASRQLSMSRLQLYKITGTCNCLTSEGRLITATADGGCTVNLMAFSVPEAVRCDAVAEAVERRVKCMRGKVSTCAFGLGWSGIQWSVEAVGPQAVSL